MDSTTNCEPSDLASLARAVRWRAYNPADGIPEWVRVGRAKFGRLARSRRLGMGLSQESVTRKYGVPQHNISWMERGGSMPPDVFDRYLSVLGLTGSDTPCTG